MLETARRRADGHGHGGLRRWGRQPGDDDRWHSDNGGGGVTAVPTITMQLVSSTGVATTTVGSLSPVFAKAQVHDTSGAAVAGAVVTFTSADGLARFIPSSGTALTDASGVATVQVLPATASSGGAGVVNAAVTVGGKAATPAAVAFQVPAGGDAATAKVSNFVLLLDRSTIPNSGTTTAKLSVLAVDGNNNVVPGRDCHCFDRCEFDLHAQRLGD